MNDIENTGETQPHPSLLREYVSRWGFQALLIVCIIIVYVQTLSFDFVSYDDYDLVARNEKYLSNPENILTSFTTHAFEGKRSESVYYRPVLQTSYILDYQIWKLNPLGYHLTNIILHALASLLLFYLLRKLTSEKFIALFGSLIFALHPIQTEAVAWIAGRNDVLLGLFIIMMLLSYIHYRELPEKRIIFFILSIVSFALALFTKEPAAFYVLLLPLYDRLVQVQTIREQFKPLYLLQLLPFVFILIGYLFIRHAIFGQTIGAEQLYGSTPMLQRYLQAPALIIEHLSLILFSLNLSVVHQTGSIIWFHSPWGIVAMILLSIWLLATILAWRFDKILALGLLWILVGFLPLMNIIPIAVPILEHRLYLPLAGFALVLARVSFMIRFSKSSSIFFPIMIVVITAAGVASFLRLPVWNNSETLWVDAIEKSPAASRSYFNLSGYYFEQQQYDKVIPVLEKYVSLEPFDFIGYTKLRQTYFLAGRYHDAAHVCKIMIAMNPTNPTRYMDAGILYERMNLPDSALIMYRNGLVADSTSYQLLSRIATVYDYTGRYDHAEYYYTRTLQHNSAYAPAYYALGHLYANKGDTAKAIQSIETGISLARPSEKDLLLLRNLYIKTTQEQKYYQLLQQLGIQ